MSREIKRSEMISYVDALPPSAHQFLSFPLRVLNKGRLRADGTWKIPGALEPLSLTRFSSVI